MSDWSAALALSLLASASAAEAAPLWTHPQTSPLPFSYQGPFVHLADKSILCIDATSSRVSADLGKTWSAPRPLFPDGRPCRVSNEHALLTTSEGTVIAAFMDLTRKRWTWKNSYHDAPGARLPTVVMRSLDQGRTWQDVQTLHLEWTGAVRDMIQTAAGRIVFTSMKMMHDPGRHAVLTYSSTDDGITWQPSNLIDLGGKGHHGGVTEPTLTQLRDGRLWMLIRTNWGEFWSAYSHDGGRFWRILQPSGIPASSAPGLVKRLADGRLVLLWNRPFPEGTHEWPLSGGDGVWSEVAVSNYREELSMAFSEDDGATWSTPVVIARQPGTWLAYPYVFEAEPGLLWITTMQGNVRLALRESDFIGK